MVVLTKNYSSVLFELLEGNPHLRFPRARRVWRERGGFRRINRNGAVYYAKQRYPLLNPGGAPLGHGLQFVKGETNAEPTGVFLTEGAVATGAEVEEAMRAYLFALGRPRTDIHVLPATLWPRCYERTEENIELLRSIGAPLPHEV